MAKTPWLDVRRPEYFDSVLESMAQVQANGRPDGDVLVHFGIGGKGVCPNYQIELPAGGSIPMRGDNHQHDLRARNSRYDEAELSECFTVEDVRVLRRRCLAFADGVAAEATPEGLHLPGFIPVQANVWEPQAQLLARLICELQAAQLASPDTSLPDLPEYMRFIMGAYACGFVCTGIEIPDAAACYKFLERDPGAVGQAPFSIQRRAVHFIIRAERWNDEDGTGGGVIEAALRNGVLPALANALDPLCDAL